MLKTISIVFTICYFTVTFAQETPTTKTNFWKNVQFGSGLFLYIENDFTNLSIAPSAIYNFNEIFAFGGGLQYSYVSQKNAFTSSFYGGNIIALANPVETLQLSVELEQLRVQMKPSNTNLTDNFWNTALFIGAGYRTDFATVGLRYNVLHNADKLGYSSTLLPFVRVYF